MLYFSKRYGMVLQRTKRICRSQEWIKGIWIWKTGLYRNWINGFREQDFVVRSKGINISAAQRL